MAEVRNFTSGGSLPYRIRTMSVKEFMRYMKSAFIALCEPCFIMDQYG
jgi:hypothetical protein